MPVSSGVTAASANRVGAVPCTGITHNGTLHSRLVLRLRQIFPEKTWAVIMSAFGISERTAKHRMAGTRDFTIEEIATLLQSEDGWEFLTVIMDTAQPRWWQVFRALKEATELAEQQRRARNKLLGIVQGAMHAHDEITAAMATAENLLLRDQNFARPYADGLRRIAGLPDRAVAATKGGKAR